MKLSEKYTFEPSEEKANRLSIVSRIKIQVWKKELCVEFKNKTKQWKSLYILTGKMYKEDYRVFLSLLSFPSLNTNEQKDKT